MLLHCGAFGRPAPAPSAYLRHGRQEAGQHLCVCQHAAPAGSISTHCQGAFPDWCGAAVVLPLYCLCTGTEQQPGIGVCSVLLCQCAAVETQLPSMGLFKLWHCAIALFAPGTLFNSQCCAACCQQLSCCKFNKTTCFVLTLTVSPESQTRKSLCMQGH